MKYTVGSIVLLITGETVSIIEVDSKKQVYKVALADNPTDVWEIKENQIYQYLT